MRPARWNCFSADSSNAFIPAFAGPEGIFISFGLQARTGLSIIMQLIAMLKDQLCAEQNY
jgi:hypothetical protein